MLPPHITVDLLQAAGVGSVAMDKAYLERTHMCSHHIAVYGVALYYQVAVIHGSRCVSFEQLISVTQLGMLWIRWSVDLWTPDFNLGDLLGAPAVSKSTHQVPRPRPLV